MSYNETQHGINFAPFTSKRCGNLYSNTISVIMISVPACSYWDKATQSNFQIQLR